MTKTPTVTESDLHTYVDGALDDAGMTRVADWLAAHPDVAKRLGAYEAQNGTLHAAYDSILDEPVPVEMVNAVTAPKAGGALLSWARIAAGIVLLAIGAAAGWGLRGGDSQAIAEVAMGAHAVYVSEIKHPVEVGADQEKHLVAWLSNRLGHPIQAPALDKAGYQLIGGRLLPDRGRPAALFMYQDEAGNRLTLYVRRDGGEGTTAFRFASDDETRAFYWIDETFAYALTGTLPRAELLALANLVYQDLGR